MARTRFVREGFTGYKDVPGGNSDPDCTHVILTVEDYNKIIHENLQSKRDLSDYKVSTTRKIQKIEEEARWKVDNAQNNADLRIDEVLQELQREREETEYQKGLNENLLRISRERANADRGLTPKKKHTGYVVLSSTEKEYRVDTRKVMVWETILQTPYPVDFTDEQVKKETETALCDPEYRNSSGNFAVAGFITKKLGIDYYYRANYEEFYRMLRQKNTYEKEQITAVNIMMQPKIRANYKAGYWEIIFIHTKSLNTIPKALRP